VQRCFRTALKDGRPIVATASVNQVGSFNMGESTDHWKPFSSYQRVVTRRPGLVWDARVVMLPGLPVRVAEDRIALAEGAVHAEQHLARWYNLTHALPVQVEQAIARVEAVVEFLQELADLGSPRPAGTACG
jgi:hypothetical protein